MHGMFYLNDRFVLLRDMERYVLNAVGEFESGAAKHYAPIFLFSFKMKASDGISEAVR